VTKIAYIRHLPRTIAGCLVVAALYGLCVFAVVSSPTTGGKVALGVLALIGVALMIRIIRAGVVVTEDGLVVRNWLRTHAVEWSRVDSFSPARDDLRHHTLGLVLADGRRLPCPAVQQLGGFRWLPPAVPAESTDGQPSRYSRFEDKRSRNRTDALPHRAADELADFVDRAARAGRLGHRADAR
jgi:PH (Pleckstrin Homology) domain-containing protein